MLNLSYEKASNLKSINEIFPNIMEDTSKIIEDNGKICDFYQYEISTNKANSKVVANEIDHMIGNGLQKIDEDNIHQNEDDSSNETENIKKKDGSHSVEQPKTKRGNKLT